MGLAALIGDTALADRIGVLGRKTTFLFVVLFCYLLLGAVVFQLIEYRARDDDIQETVAELELERAQLLEVSSCFSYTSLTSYTRIAEVNLFQYLLKKMSI